MGFWTDERREICRNMIAGGATYGQVATAVGATRNSVSGYVDREAKKCGERWRRPRKKTEPTTPKRPYKRHNDGAVLPPVPPPPPEQPVSGGVPTIELRRGDCRYVLSAESPWLHCGEAAEPHSAWCSRHRKVVYAPSGKKDVA